MWTSFCIASTFVLASIVALGVNAYDEEAGESGGARTDHVQGQSFARASMRIERKQHEANASEAQRVAAAYCRRLSP